MGGQKRRPGGRDKRTGAAKRTWKALRNYLEDSSESSSTSGSEAEVSPKDLLGWLKAKALRRKEKKEQQAAKQSNKGEKQTWGSQWQTSKWQPKEWQPSQWQPGQWESKQWQPRQWQQRQRQ